eukprot:6281689-Alexandrium_andersonii.AAC.1
MQTVGSPSVTPVAEVSALTSFPSPAPNTHLTAITSSSHQSLPRHMPVLCRSLYSCQLLLRRGQLTL